MDLTTITPADFKAQFPRDFPYAPVNSQDPLKYVLDADISNAFLQAQMKFNPALVPAVAAPTSPAAATKLCYLYLTAHYLCIDTLNAIGGLQGGSGTAFPVTGRTVGSVSESYQVPDRFKNNLNMLSLTKTGYGQKYLDMVLPAMVGNMFASPADTNP